MKSQALGLRVAGTIFGLVCVGHLWRIMTRVDILIGGHELPLWPNIIGLAAAGALSVWMWQLSSKPTG